MKRVLFLLLIFIITIKGASAQDETEFPNLVKNGDFENGATGFKSDFIWAEEDFINWGFYVITDNSAKYLGGGVFLNPIPKTGKYYFIDMNNSGKQRLWYQEITVKPNTTYEFSCILANVCNEFPAPGVMSLKISGTNGTTKCPGEALSNGSCAWKPYKIKYKTGPDETSVEISIVDEIWTLMGNDVALDNIVFKEIPSGEYSSPCPTFKEKFQPLADADKGVVKDNNTVVKKTQSTFVAARIEEKIKDSIAATNPVVVVTPDPPKVDPPKKDPPKVDPPKVDPPKVDPPKIDTVKVDPPKIDPPKVDPPKVDPPKVDPPKVDPPKVDPPKVDPPKPPKPPRVDTPKPPKPPVVTTVKPTKPPKPPKPPRIDPPKKDPPVVKPKPEKPKVFSSEIKIAEIKENETLEMSHINFGKGTYHLLPTSIPELKDLVKFMKDNTSVRIRLEGHTESGGDPTKNILLSENRVKEVKKYLVENGVETGRIEWIGHGGGKPLYVGDDEEQKKLNRRVEVVVINK